METTDICLKNCEIRIEKRTSKKGGTYRVVVCYTEDGSVDLCFYDKNVENKILRMMIGL